ncbi:hypothetical protein SSPS47_13890 [Streptomyces sp. S4.7]|nr:hypothetical protein [Streptomyces sp. S4.7]QHY96205.1 hypothetical protein SSPS47_13890 [Streptomyces sp. S4.7]
MTPKRRTRGTRWRHDVPGFTQDSATLRRLLAALGREPPIDSAAICNCC